MPTATRWRTATCNAGAHDARVSLPSVLLRSEMTHVGVEGDPSRADIGRKYFSARNSVNRISIRLTERGGRRGDSGRPVGQPSTAPRQTWAFARRVARRAGTGNGQPLSVRRSIRRPVPPVPEAEPIRPAHRRFAQEHRKQRGGLPVAGGRPAVKGCVRCARHSWRGTRGGDRRAA